MKKNINLVILKRVSTDHPSVFEDTVHSVKYILKLLGYNTYISYNSIDPNIPNIIWGAGTYNTQPINEIRKITSPKNTIFFNMEQLGSSSELLTSEYYKLINDYATLDYNQANIKYLQDNHYSNSGLEFPLLPSQEFRFDYEINPINQKYDLAFYGALTTERQMEINQLREIGLTVKLISNNYGVNLANKLIGCSAIFNSHAYTTSIFETARCLRPFAMGIPIISELSVLPCAVDWANSGVIFLKKEDLVMETQKIITEKIPLIESTHKMIRFLNHEKYLDIANDLMKKILKTLVL